MKKGGSEEGLKDPIQDIERDSRPVVFDRYLEVVDRTYFANPDSSLAVCLVNRLFRVCQDVQEHLDHLVFIYHRFTNLQGKLGDNLDVVRWSRLFEQ